MVSVCIYIYIYVYLSYIHMIDKAVLVSYII